MNDRVRNAIRQGVCNSCPAAFVVPFLVHSPWPWAAKIPLTLPIGTFGWFVGWVLATVVLAAWVKLTRARPGGPLYTFTRLPEAEYPAAGGKGASLARMAKAGLPVPPGIVVLSRAFDGDQLTSAAQAQLAKAVRKLTRKGQLLAVRSSALAEDSAQASFAGAYESVLNVAAADVAAAIAEVRRSGQATRVGAYAEARGVEIGDQVAVVVQRMVRADYAGVLFTADPLSGDLSTMVGNAVAGLGESLVSGAANAEEFRLHRPDGAFTGPDALAPAAKTLHREAHLAETTLAIGSLDIEWAVVGKKVWLLQARPVTTMVGWDPVTAERNDSLRGVCLWSATNLVEANPEPQTPLTISTADYVMAHGGPLIRAQGRNMSGYIGGRPYNNLSVQLAIRGPQVAKDPRAEYRKMATLWGELPDAVPIPMLPTTKADQQRDGLQMLRTLRPLMAARRKLAAFVAESPGRCAELAERITATADPAALLRLWSEEIFPGYRNSFWSVVAATPEQDSLEGELRELVGPDDAATLLASVAHLAGNLESLGPAEGLQEVAAGRMTAEEYLERYGHRGYNETELAWPRPNESPSSLSSWDPNATSVAKDDHHFDHHASSLSSWDMNAAGVHGPGISGRSPAPPDTAGSYTEALARLHASHPQQAHKLEKRLLERARTASRREAVRSEAVRWTGVVRSFAVRAGDLLGIGDDVFLLTMDELLAALDGDTTPYAHFQVRRETLDRYRQLPPPPVLIVGPFDPFAWAADPNHRTDYWVAGAESETSPDPQDTSTVKGVPGAKGVVEGVVRRIDNIADADRLQSGEILVTQLTNIGWTPVFPRAGAIVTDIGAALSHAAIVARELGVPAVVGCGNATTKLSTGDRVRVDGAAGTVQLL
jgi:pyruvate,water dikinase